MKNKIILTLSTSIIFLGALTSCNASNEKTLIKVCASELPHADILNNCVKDILKEKGYTLKVTILDWTLQNEAVTNKDYDANYFQHIPYLNSDEQGKDLFAVCKVHYEPLTIYQGKSNATDVKEGKTFEICSDTSNAIRAFTLLQEKGVLTNIPVDESGENLTILGSTYTENEVTVTLIDEALLAASLNDYDFGLLPCNTALTAGISSDKLVGREDNPEQVSLKANVLAARSEDYKSDQDYKTKIDLLADALLSEAVSSYVNDKYKGNITCDSSTQIDLR